MSSRTKEQTKKLLPATERKQKSADDDAKAVVAHIAESFSRELSDDTIAGGPKGLGRDSRIKKGRHPGRPKGSKLQLVSEDFELKKGKNIEDHQGHWETVPMVAQQEKQELRAAQVSKTKLKLVDQHEAESGRRGGLKGSSRRLAAARAPDEDDDDEENTTLPKPPSGKRGRKGMKGAKKKAVEEEVTSAGSRRGNIDEQEEGWETDDTASSSSTKKVPVAEYWNQMSRHGNREVQEHITRTSQLAYSVSLRGGKQYLDGKGVFEKTERGRLRKQGQGRSLRWGWPSPGPPPKHLRNSAKGNWAAPSTLNRRLRDQGELRKKLRNFDPNNKEDLKNGSANI